MATFLVPGLIAGVGFTVTTACVALAVRAFGNARLLADAAPTPVAELDDGLHEVSGRLQADGELQAPQTGRAAAFYRLVLEQRRRNRWETVLDQRASLPGAIGDDTGAVALRLDDADVVVASPDRVRTGVFAVPSAELDALLARVAPPSIPPAGPFLRWREEILLAGDRVFAVGTARNIEGEWALHPVDGAPLLVSDRGEADVVRHQRRAGQRWAAIGLVGIGVALWGGWGLLPLL
ncbi:MAG: GIDE domain-containing protein [Pseudomonadota bacterium]|nr:GIDE domain-containing protein [Pseudomonadota bacterium]